MRNCVNCPEPPGGEVCCDEGQTPICIVKDGRSRSLCRFISEADSASPAGFAYVVLDDLVALVGEEYRDEILAYTVLSDGIFFFESLDRRVRISALQVGSESGTLQPVPYP